jgi:hypothetical protein
MKKIAALVVSFLLVFGVFSKAEAGIGWGTLSDKIEVSEPSGSQPLDQDTCLYSLLWTVLLPIIL